MSGIGFSELIILCLIGLIVLGPERLPRVANQIGGWLGQARRMTRVMKRQLEDELDLEGKQDIRPPPGEPTSSPFPPKSAPDDSLNAEPEAPDEYVAANEHDDTWSPAHDDDSAGTGVGDVDVPAVAETQSQETDESEVVDDDSKERSS